MRGTVHDIEQEGWLLDFFGERFGKGKFELVEVADITVSNAFDDAFKGADGVIHVAAAVVQFYDPHEIIRIIVEGVLNALKAAAKAHSFKQFVMVPPPQRHDNNQSKAK